MTLVLGSGGTAAAAETSGVEVKAAADGKVAGGSAAGGTGGSSNDRVDSAVTLIATGGMIGIITAWALHRSIIPITGASVPGGLPVLGVTCDGFPTCDAARRAGLTTPIHQGQPGYSPALDHDKDGIACERGGVRCFSPLRRGFSCDGEVG